MLQERMISAINDAIREHYGIVPKYIAMNRNSYNLLKSEGVKGQVEHNVSHEDMLAIEKGSFFGIKIRIIEMEKEFELSFYVDPISKEK